MTTVCHELETNTSSRLHFHYAWPICMQTKEIIFERGVLLFLFWSVGMAVVRKEWGVIFIHWLACVVLTSLFPLLSPIIIYF